MNHKFKIFVLNLYKKNNDLAPRDIIKEFKKRLKNKFFSDKHCLKYFNHLVKYIILFFANNKNVKFEKDLLPRIVKDLAWQYAGAKNVMSFENIQLNIITPWLYKSINNNCYEFNVSHYTPNNFDLKNLNKIEERLKFTPCNRTESYKPSICWCHYLHDIHWNEDTEIVKFILEDLSLFWKCIYFINMNKKLFKKKYIRILPKDIRKHIK